MNKIEETKQFMATREDVAEMFLIGVHEVNNLWKHHGMPKESRGVFDLRKVVPFYIRRKNAEINAKKHGDMTKLEAERQLTIYNMELVKIELAEKQKQTVAVKDIEKIITPPLISTAKKLDTLTKEIQSTFPKDEPVEVRRAREEKINRILDDARNELASIPEKLTGTRPPKKEKKRKRSTK